MSSSAALLGVILVAAALLYLPPAEFALGGWDPGVYFNTAFALATHGGFIVPDPLLVAAGPAVQRALVADGYLQPGFYWDPDGGGTVTQFPFLLAVWMAVAVLAAGPHAAFYVPVVVALLATLSFYLFARRVVGSTAALVAAALLAFNGLQLWHAKLSLAEEMVQLFLFGGLWAGLVSRDRGVVSRDRGDRTAAVAAGLALGLLPLVKTEATLLGVLGCLAVGRPSRWFWAPYLGASLVAAAHYAAFARMAGSLQLAAVWPFLAATGLLAGVSVVILLVWRRRPGLLFAPGAAAGLVVVTALPPPDLGFLGAVWTGLYLTPADGALLALAPFALRARGVSAGDKPTPYGMMIAFAAAAVFYLLLFHHYYGARDEIPLFMWGARRLVPVVLPLLILAEAAGLVWAVRRWVAPRRHAVAVAAAMVLLIGLRAPDLAPLIEEREYHGALNAVATIAARVEPDAVVLLDNDDVGIRFAAPLRWVEHRASYLLRDSVPAELVRTQRPVYYVTAKPEPRSLAEHTLQPRGSWRFQLPELERTSERRPARWNLFTADIRLFRVGTLAE